MGEKSISYDELFRHSGICQNAPKGDYDAEESGWRQQTGNGQGETRVQPALGGDLRSYCQPDPNYHKPFGSIFLGE
jgi:hypothetical protein